jgi:flagellar hook assembly protein FlgD
VDPALGASDLRFAVPQPNPFGAKTTLQFQLPRQTTVSLAIYDAQGRRVRTLLPTGSMVPGSHSIEWDGRDEAGVRAASGVYFAQLTAGASRVVQRAVLMKGD